MCSYTSWRGDQCCTCLATWLPVFEAEAKSRGVISESIKVLQLRGSNPASADTHSAGGVFDFGYYHDGQADDLVWIARQMGADATWFREWDNNHHVHGVLTNCPRNGPAAYQIEAVKDGYNGLGYMGQEGADDGPRPLSGRTWQQGIEWAEEDMATAKEIWEYNITRGEQGPYQAQSWLTLAGSDASAALDKVIALEKRVASLESLLKSVPQEVWNEQISRGDNGPYQAQSWLTLAGTQADAAAKALKKHEEE